MVGKNVDTICNQNQNNAIWPHTHFDESFSSRNGLCESREGLNKHVLSNILF